MLIATFDVPIWNDNKLQGKMHFYDVISLINKYKML